MEKKLIISTDMDRLDMNIVYETLETSYWARGRSRITIQKSISNSLCFGAYMDGQMVAFARVVTDRAVFAYLMDLFVVPQYQGRGMSKVLMRAILNNPDLQDISSFLLATLDAHSLYSQFGFQPIENPDRLMTLKNLSTSKNVC